MQFLINPAGKSHGAPRRKRSSKAPSKKQLAARRKFAAASRARAAAKKKAKRASSGGEVTMAVRRKKKSAGAAARRGTKRRRRHSVARRTYSANPRRRKHARRRYRRNPPMGRGILGQATDLFVGAGVGLVGMGIGRTVSNLIPFHASTPANQPYIDFAKGAAVALGIRILGEKVVGREMARMAAVGAMLNPTKNLILSFVPAASQYLGAADRGRAVTVMPGFPGGARRTVSGYPGQVGAYPQHAAVGAYPRSSEVVG